VLWATLAALLGIPLWLIIAAGFFIWWRFRMIRKDPRSVRVALRVAEGEVANVKDTWKRGYIVWESDVLIWAKIPSLLKLTAVQGASVSGLGPADPDEVKKMGDDPRRGDLLLASGAVLELAWNDEDAESALGPFA
jgi:hypothetical protein